MLTESSVLSHSNEVEDVVVHICNEINNSWTNSDTDLISPFRPAVEFYQLQAKVLF